MRRPHSRARAIAKALPLAARHAFDRDVDRGNLDLQRVEDGAGLLAHLPVVDEVEELRQRVGRELLAAEIDVLVRRHRVDQREVLVDRLDPRIHRVLGTPQLQRLAVGKDLAAARRQDAGQNLEQCRFAGAVVAHQTENLVPVEAQRRVGEGNDGSEIARDVTRLEHGPRNLPHRTSPRSKCGTSVPQTER